MKTNLLSAWRSRGGPRRLRELRTARGMSLAALAAKIDASKGTLSKLENPNLQTNPGLDMIEAIAGALGIALDEFFEPESKRLEQRVHPGQVSLDLYLREMKISPANARKFRKVLAHPAPPETVPEWRRFTEWVTLFTGRDPRPAGTRVQRSAAVQSFRRA